MSLAGFKKQINKANQFVSEKIGGAKGTELDDDFVEMERKTDAMGRMADELMARTHELLQPNPASRAKLSAVRSISKLRGQSNQSLYPQPEGQLGDCMTKYGKEIGDDTLFGQALSEAGESYRQLADVKYSLEDNVKQNFIEPLLQLQSKELKDANHHRKKMQGRRLDYDCKKRRQEKGPVFDEELRSAEEKFEESKQAAGIAMHSLLDNESEQVVQLSSFIEAELTFHQQSAAILQALIDSLHQKCNEAVSKPRKEYIPKVMPRSGKSSPSQEKTDGLYPPKSNLSSSRESLNSGGGKQPTCEALYDFDPENVGELGLKEGDIVRLVSRIDDNWLEGSVRGQTGYFPANFVKILVDLPPE